MDGIFDLAEAFETVSLTKVTHTVLGRVLEDGFEVAESLVPLLLKDENLTSCYIGF